MAETERLRDPATRTILVILTDGLANIDLAGNMRSETPYRDTLLVAHEIVRNHVPAVLIDTNPYPTVTNEAGLKVPSPSRELARALAADYYQYSPPSDTGLLRKEE